MQALNDLTHPEHRLIFHLDNVKEILNNYNKLIKQPQLQPNIIKQLKE